MSEILALVIVDIFFMIVAGLLFLLAHTIREIMAEHGMGGIISMIVIVIVFSAGGRLFWYFVTINEGSIP